MTTRRAYIEQFLRQIYGSFPTDDSTITVNLVNQWLNQAIGIAARANYIDGIRLDGIGYVNNSFYTTFKGIAIEQDEQFTWKVTLPQIPVGIGRNEGISTFKVKDEDNNISLPLIPISENQKTYYQGMRPIPNKVIYYYEGNEVFIKTTMLLNDYTATVTMVSGGDSSNLDSILNIPDDYIPQITEYLQKQLLLERMQPVDASNDGQDAVKTT